MNQDQETTAGNPTVETEQGQPTKSTEETSSVEDSQPEAQSFPADYVQELRAEAAEYRTRSKSMATQLVTAWAAADGRLLDPTDLPASAVEADDDGTVTRDAVTAAIDALVKAKPHLAKQRPAPLPQGATTTPEPVSLLRLLSR